MAVAQVCPPMAEMLEKKVSMLLLQYVPGRNLETEEEAFLPRNLPAACKALGRLFTLDLLLGNADRLPIQSLGWRGNPGNTIWSPGARCVPIDAAVARRPPKLLVRDMDQKALGAAGLQAAWLLELALLDRQSAQEVLLDAVSCNPAAVATIQADWAINEGRADGAMSGVKAFHEGLKSALAAAVEEQGLLEMMTDVVDSWVQNFKADMKGFQTPQLKLGATAELRALSKQESKPDAFRERLASWQDLLREKTKVLHQAVHDWAHRRDRRSSFSFRGFLGESVLNPVADAYELLVRLRQLTSRIKVLHIASSVSRPADLGPQAVSVCLAYLVSVKQMALADALAYVKSKRPVARPNAGFLKQLLGLELESLGKNSALPEDLLRGKPVLSSSSGEKQERTGEVRPASGGQVQMTWAMMRRQ
eukprot:Skav217731  [mRNA]  locus=scaffold3421:4355:10802:+ [translate_table: standard]